MNRLSVQPVRSQANHFGGAQSKGLATRRNVSKLTFLNKIGHAQSVGFRFYLASLRGRLGFIRLFDEVKVEIVRDI